MRRILSLLAVLLASGAARADDCPSPTGGPIVVEDFALVRPLAGKEFPADWTKPQERGGQIDYFVQREAGRPFLRGHYLPGTSSEAVARRRRHCIADHPVLAWSWRIAVAPDAREDADRREEWDAAATMYVVYRTRWGQEAIKLIVSRKFPAGTVVEAKTSLPLRRLWIEVLGCLEAPATKGKGCTRKVGEWQRERVDLLAAHRLAYPRSKAPVAIEGVGVMVDGDRGGNRPILDVADIRLEPR